MRLYKDSVFIQVYRSTPAALVIGGGIITKTSGNSRLSIVFESAVSKPIPVGFDEINKKWTDNADQISQFLSKANPNWALNDMKNMMHQHFEIDNG
jgi:hypothetical protein